MSNAPKILITGLDSFTGGHLRPFLEQSGYAVCGTSNLESDVESGVYLCDITDKDAIADVLRRAQPDYAIHLAGISYVGHEDLGEYYLVNTMGTQWLLEALAEHAPDLKKLVIASSAAVYGRHEREVLDETLCPQPESHYAISKLAAEHAARAFFDRLPIVIVRPFNYTGRGQPGRFVIPKIADHFKKGETAIELGNTAVVREFNDVGIVCHAYKALLESGQCGEIVNLCTGRGVALDSIVDKLEEISGREIEVRTNPDFVRENEQNRLVGSPEKLNAMIGDLPVVPLEQTLRDMMQD